MGHGKDRELGASYQPRYYARSMPAVQRETGQVCNLSTFIWQIFRCDLAVVARKSWPVPTEFHFVERLGPQHARQQGSSDFRREDVTLCNYQLPNPSFGALSSTLRSGFLCRGL